MKLQTILDHLQRLSDESGKSMTKNETLYFVSGALFAFESTNIITPEEAQGMLKELYQMLQT